MTSALTPEQSEVLKSVTTGQLIAKVVERANEGMRPGSAMHWQWCTMLERLAAASLRSMPAQILDMTDDDYEVTPHTRRMSPSARAEMERELTEGVHIAAEIQNELVEETMYKDAIEVVHIKFDPSNPTWWRSRDEWVKDRTALWRERYPTAREQRRLRVRTYGELRTDELGKTWFHIDLVLERSGSDLISL